jgi:hypothetical protein
MKFDPVPLEEFAMRKPLFLILVVLVAVCKPLATFAEDDVLPVWLLKIKVNADFRYRHELIAAQQYDAAGRKADTPDRNRERIRLRLGISYNVNPKFDIITRFATSTFSSGAGDPVSTNQDLTNASAPKPFWVDRAYADYHPNTNLAVRAGRFAVPYEGTDLLWDADLNLEGIAVAGNSKKIGENWDLLGRAGGFWLTEQATGPDEAMFGAQGGIRNSGKPLGGQIAVGYYDYSNLKNGPLLIKAFGNSAAGGRYLLDYNLLDISGQIKYTQAKWEGTILGDFATNTAVDSNHTAYLAGFVLKVMQLPVDWELGYNYRDVKRDAVVGTFDDSDAGGGGTNFKGHKMSLSFAVAKNTRLGATYFTDTNDPDHAKFHYNRLQGDLELKF